MDVNQFSQLDESLYYEKLPNGLDVYILPKKGFQKTFAVFTTKYGSIDNHFVPLGEKDELKVPDGIAHFLEHKLFEKEDGDVFQSFSKQGASANAFTSFTRTAYLFSGTSNVQQNLETLIDFVQDPYFTEETVEKEKGIIGQEITMYDDNPDWRAYFGVIENMYQNHPVKIDIAGTKESIAKITDELLYTCYNTFYHPSNMLLFIVGAVEPERIMQQVRENQSQKEYQEQPPIERFSPDEPEAVHVTEKELHMSVQRPKCMIGFKGSAPQKRGIEKLKIELAMKVLLDMIFGKSSPFYEQLYEAGLIDETFSYDYTEEGDFAFAIIGSDSSEPKELSKRIKQIALNERDKVLTEEQLERIRRKKIGSFLRSLNSPEFIANQFTRYQFHDMNLFSIVEVLEKLTLSDVKASAEELFQENRFTSFYILPKASQS
ncbi:EF-P 5-aminopentanol modification-associated protein YfmH [Bacillus solimangrovi]|uniref:Zinc protease n=1 Tax=Bacillus solimangrovi TaxID=1305675 RepID=A0A1E5LJ88_9BACI|nr:pitrilysin family protein [Bacillus solimangrovi]OEH94144.1 zinc protease [Bacillus solimangrovi]